MKKDRKNMTIVRYGNCQDAPELTFKSFADLRESLIVQNISGLFFILTKFLFLIPFDPPRANIIEIKVFLVIIKLMFCLHQQ